MKKFLLSAIIFCYLGTTSCFSMIDVAATKRANEPSFAEPQASKTDVDPRTNRANELSSGQRILLASKTLAKQS